MFRQIAPEIIDALRKQADASVLYDGLFDRRRGKPSPKRVPVTTVEKVLGLYREKYFDLNVRHFHEKLREQHQIDLSYSWVKSALQGAGLVARQRNVVSIASGGRGGPCQACCCTLMGAIISGFRTNAGMT